MSKRNPTKHVSGFVSGLCWFLSKPLCMANAGMRDPTVLVTLRALWVHYQGC